MSEAAMKEAAHPPRAIGSVGAVLAGLIVGVLLTIVTDVMLRAIGVYPPSGQPTVNADALLLLATASRVVYGVLGATSQRGSRLIGRCDTLWRGALWALRCVPLAQW
jgi:hypothetical protein